jgi:hypothetical protein
MDSLALFDGSFRRDSSRTALYLVAPRLIERARSPEPKRGGIGPFVTYSPPGVYTKTVREPAKTEEPYIYRMGTTPNTRPVVSQRNVVYGYEPRWDPDAAALALPETIRSYS